MVPGINRDSARQFASASCWGVRPVDAESLFNVSDLCTVYASHPGGGSHRSDSVKADRISVGVSVGWLVGIGVGLMVGVLAGGAVP